MVVWYVESTYISVHVLIDVFGMNWKGMDKYGAHYGLGK